MSVRFRSVTLPLLVTLLVAGGCAKSGSGPDADRATMDRIAGSYLANDNYGAIRFTTTENGKTTDVLAEGVTLQINLGADGRTTGRLFAPGREEDGSDLDADLSGTWTVHGDTVRFQQSADTFVRDMPFVIVGTRLEGDEDFGDQRVQVTLEKKP